MTKINKLIMSGFKSFASKTELLFGNTINTILGPNGNGKSNVLDALCFVLGRTSSKSMRAEKTSHLIFDGGKKKKRSEKGQVDIYFDNSSDIFPIEGNEVKVSRIIKKTGQSTYKINDKTHTRSEVLDLLSAARIDPNGYNIILQGDITRFVEMSAIERRKILEEISGISVYEERKHKAVLELEKVEKKLNDAEIIMKERKTHLRELKKDRDQALKFKEVKDGIDSHKATYIHLQMAKKNSTKDKFEHDLTRLKKKFDDVEEKISGFKNFIEEKKSGVKKITQEIEQKGEVEQVRISKQIENMRVTLEKDKARVVMVKDALSKIEQRKQALEKDLRDSEKNVGEFEKKRQLLLKQRADKETELRRVEQKIAAFKKKNKLDSLGDIEQDIDEVDTSIEEKQATIQQIRQLQQELFREKDKIEYQIQTLDERVKKVAHLAKENQDQISTLKKKKETFKQVTLELNKCLDHDSSSSREMGAIRKEMHALEEERAKLSVRQISSQERVGGDIAVRKIRVLKKKKTGIYGTVAELGKVDRKYALALEIAAGGRLMSVVVEDDRVAAQCIKYLRDNKFGVATFIPLNKIKSPSVVTGIDAVLKKSGVHNRCVDLVRYDKRFAKAFRYVFGDTVVVDNLDVARNVGVGRVRMVTLGGDLADMSGVMRGGFHHRKKAASFAESDVENDLLDVESKIGALRMKIDGFMKSRQTNEQSILKLRREKLELEGEIARMEKTLHLGSDDLDATTLQKKNLQKELSDIDKKLRDVQSSVSAKNRELASIKGKKEQLKMKISTLRNPRLIAELTAFDEARQQVREELVKLQSEGDALKSQITQMMKPEQDRIHELMKGHDKEHVAFTKELGELAKKIKKDDALVKEKEKSQRAFFSAYKDLFQKRDKLSEQVNGAERKIDTFRDQSRRTEIDMNSHTLKLAALKSELSGLEEQMKQLKNAKILKGKSEDELKGEIHRFERLLSTMSAVNMKALEIYEQVEVEYNKLIEKKETLLTEKIDVVALMEEIEGKKKEQFMKTFDKINKNFNEKFQSLTKKGKAFLHLENAAKPFEGGMGIKIKISGQRFMDIRSLSGGEKTMTALAFYFAVQEHEPHSFYLMDEVDAALDKHNSERLSQLIRQYCKNAQYIVISHNDALISESDHLYGVSMDETGVSKVVSLKV
jgi:chromosome segregation protein